MPNSSRKDEKISGIAVCDLTGSEPGMHRVAAREVANHGTNESKNYKAHDYPPHAFVERKANSESLKH